MLKITIENHDGIETFIGLTREDLRELKRLKTTISLSTEFTSHTGNRMTVDVHVLHQENETDLRKLFEEMNVHVEPDAYQKVSEVIDEPAESIAVKEKLAFPQPFKPVIVKDSSPNDTTK